MMAGQYIDEELLRTRSVMSCVDSSDGIGYDVHLSCGHKVWHAVHPGAAVYCGLCLQRLVNQVHGFQKESRQMPLD